MLCFRVFGIKGLRVVDASIFPRQITGHPQAVAIMVADKAADLIKYAWRNKYSDDHISDYDWPYKYNNNYSNYDYTYDRYP